MGASYLARNVAALADGGRLVVIGMQGGRKAELDLGALLAKRATVAATALRSRPLAEKAEIVRGVREQVWPLVEAGRIRPVVDRRLPMPTPRRRTGWSSRATTSARCCSPPRDGRDRTATAGTATPRRDRT